MKKEIKLEQKKIFLKGEGDNWYLRNKKFSNKERFKTKYLYSKINQIIKKINNKLNFLEIGSSNGLFLLLLKKKIKNCNLIGVDPSKKAIKNLKTKNIKGIVGTADKLPVERNSQDIILYGFCLYLCDKSDYRKIRNEAYRVLKKDKFLIIFDFYSIVSKKNIYKHDKRIFSFKIDFSKIFLKNNKFRIIKKNIFKYDYLYKISEKKFSKDQLSIIILKKK